MKNILPLIKSPYLLLFFSIILAVSGCNKDDEEPPRPTESVIEIISTTEGLDSLASIIGQPGTNNPFANRLSSDEYTVFAPNNAAINNLLNSIGLQSVSELRTDLLSDLIFNHIIANTTIESNQLDSTVTAFNNAVLNLSTEGDTVVINADTQPSRTVVVTPNLRASNGIVHVINEVILPNSLRQLQPYFGTVVGLTTTVGLFGGLTTITNVFNEAGLISTLSGTNDYTVLAPVNGAFNNFFSGSEINKIANYHILEGDINLASAGRTIRTLAGDSIYVTNDNGTIFLNGIFTLDAGLTANNGRVIYLAGVLNPAEELDNVISIAEAQSGASFEIFRTALRETDFQFSKNSTIFMPTDSAFKAAGLVTSIDSTSAARIDPTVLTNILQTHIIGGINFSSDLALEPTTSVQTLNGTALTINFTESANSATWTIADANQTTPDAQLIISASDNLSTNGVVHVINNVLLPPL